MVVELPKFQPGIYNVLWTNVSSVDGHALAGSYPFTVLKPDGTVARRIKVNGSMPTNLAFGPMGDKTIYVTEVETGSVQILDVDTDGFPLHL